jgi:rRNA processing protein Krr1/Pno1
VVSGPSEVLQRLRGRIIGTVGGDALEVRVADTQFEVPLTGLQAAHEALAPALA